MKNGTLARTVSVSAARMNRRTFFSWENGQIVFQFDGPASAEPAHRYLFNPLAIDQILADENALNEVIWPLTDHLGTPRDLVTYDLATHASTIANHRVFDSFGILVSQTDTDFQTAFGFTGVYFDTATSLNYHRNRWYDPAVGRWINEDPIGFVAGDSNLYRYVHNSPTNKTDPSGLEGVGAVIGEGGAGIGQGGLDILNGSQNIIVSTLNIPAGAGNTLMWTIRSTFRFPYIPHTNWAQDKITSSELYPQELNMQIGGTSATILTGQAAPRVFCSGASTALFSMRNVRRAWWGGATPVRPNPIMPRGREYMELSHTYIPNGGWGNYVPEFIKNRPWNLNPMWGTQHALVDPLRHNFMNAAWKSANPLPGPMARLWGRMPASHRITVGAGACGATGYGTYILLDDGTDPEE